MDELPSGVELWTLDLGLLIHPRVWLPTSTSLRNSFRDVLEKEFLKIPSFDTFCQIRNYLFGCKMRDRPRSPIQPRCVHTISAIPSDLRRRNPKR